jgi:serine/threonine-protein kinase
LFFGDSDLETVRQVQAARIPPLHQINPTVGKDLERVVARSLARDPAQRYQSARDFGRDLNAILFSARRPVSSFEIAELVALPLAQREVDRASRAKDGGSIISSLIEEALFEFVSLGDSGLSQSGAAPLGTNLQFGGPQNWSGQLGDSGFGVEAGTARVGPSSSRLEIGNLAALEDEHIPQSRLLRAVTGAAPRMLSERSQSLGRRATGLLIGAVLLIVVGIATGFIIARRGASRVLTPAAQWTHQ